VVYHSVFQVDKFQDVPHFAAKFVIERALRAFDVPWTVIRPNNFFQNDKMLRDAVFKAGVYPAPLGDTGISTVDVRDIAEATAIALTSDGHDDRIYNLNGPDLLSGPKAADIWSKLLGRTGALRERVPAWSAFDFRMMFQGYLERGFAAEPTDLETLTTLIGHLPRTYEAFARETAAEWVM
jgi:uncharacterized protein YbjT (DUF2867 family)